MPPTIATPAQADAAKREASQYTDLRTGEGGGMNRFKRARPITRFEREALNSKPKAVHIYNRSTIYSYQKIFPGLGPITIQPRKRDEEYWPGISLERNLVRSFDGGNSVQRFMIETPLEIVQDLFVCSPDHPGRPENNLHRFGCFYTVDSPIEELSNKQEILDEAEFKLRNWYFELLAHADGIAGGPLNALIVEVHRKAALYLQEVGAIKDLPDWVARRAKLDSTDECRFCGFENKRGSVKCRNCHEVLDQEAYDKLKASLRKK